MTLVSFLDAVKFFGADTLCTCGSALCVCRFKVLCGRSGFFRSLAFERSFMLHSFFHCGISGSYPRFLVSSFGELFVLHLEAPLSLRIVTGEARVAISETIPTKHCVQIFSIKIT